MEIKKKKVGDRIRVGEYNEIVDRLNSSSSAQPPSPGYHGPMVSALSANFQSKNRFPIIAKSSVEIPPYSVFGIAEGQEFNIPPKVDVKKFSESDGKLLIFTNDSVEMQADKEYLIRAIGVWDITLVQLENDDEETVPSVGFGCGPLEDAFTVSAKGFGLVCLTEPNDDNRIFVMAAPMGERVVKVTLTEAISSGSATCNLLDDEGNDTGEDIEVYAWINYTGGESGTKAMARWCAGMERWEFCDMDCEEE